jgi:glyoxylase-like metal-dependent hydrolase (beta-lactamase superfamily II)
MKSAPGVHTLTLPMPWELETVNVHLIDLDSGYLLVDSGIGTEECFNALEEGLGKLGIRWRDIRTLLLTHLHPDHIGLSWKILELSGAKLMMHRAEVEYLALVARESRAPFFLEAMRMAGVPQDMQKRMDYALRDVRRNFREHSPDTLLEGGEKIPIRGGTLEALWTPGHSPGHVCLYSPEYRYLISGDHILQFITPNIGWHPDSDMLAEYLHSLDKLNPFDIDLILPSHGNAFRGHRERIKETAEHHELRCGQIAGLIQETPMTAYGIVQKIWPKGLTAFHQHFAVFEILAHLEYMQRRGRVEARENEALYWSAVG